MMCGISRQKWHKVGTKVAIAHFDVTTYKTGDHKGRLHRDLQVRVLGLEPKTYGLKGRCSTN